MTTKLFIGAFTKFLLGIVLVGLLIFLPAGSLSFFNGWLFISILFAPITIAGIVMMFKNPALLEKRLNGKEVQKEQGIVVKLSGLMFLAGFLQGLVSVLVGTLYRKAFPLVPLLYSF